MTMILTCSWNLSNNGTQQKPCTITDYDYGKRI